MGNEKNEYAAKDKAGKDVVIRRELINAGKRTVEDKPLEKEIFVAYVGGNRVTHSDTLDGLRAAGFIIEDAATAPEKEPEEGEGKAKAKAKKGADVE